MHQTSTDAPVRKCSYDREVHNKKVEKDLERLGNRLNEVIGDHVILGAKPSAAAFYD